MGVTHGDPVWDDVRQELTLRVIKVFRVHNPVATGTLSYPTRLVYHAHIGLIFLTNHLSQRWHLAEASFIDRPSKMGMSFGAYENRVRAKHTWNGSPRLTYAHYTSTGIRPIFKSMTSLYAKSTTGSNSLYHLKKASQDHVKNRVDARPPNIKLRSSTLVQKPVALKWD